MTRNRFVFVFICLILFLPPVTLISQSETTLEVARIVLCESVLDREPSNVSEDFSPDINRVYCFTEIQNAADPVTITHRWYHGENLMAEVPLSVQGGRYRTWSSKQIVPQATGAWRVEVVDESGTALREIAFRVSAVGEEAPAE